MTDLHDALALIDSVAAVRVVLAGAGVAEHPLHELRAVDADAPVCQRKIVRSAATRARRRRGRLCAVQLDRASWRAAQKASTHTPVRASLLRVPTLPSASCSSPSRKLAPPFFAGFGRISFSSSAASAAARCWVNRRSRRVDRILRVGQRRVPPVRADEAGQIVGSNKANLFLSTSN